MLTAEENERLTRVGRGTPAGEMLRTMKSEGNTEPADDEDKPEIKIVDRRHWADENEENIDDNAVIDLHNSD